MFFWNSLAFSMIQQMLAIWSLVPLPFLKPAWTSGSSTVHVLLKPGLENFEHYFTSMWDECNCAVVCHSMDVGLSELREMVMDREVWRAAIHGVAKSRTWLSDWIDWLSILCHCLSLELEWKLTFSSPVATAEFSIFAGILSAALSQHHLLGFE